MSQWVVDSAEDVEVTASRLRKRAQREERRVAAIEETHCRQKTEEEMRRRHLD